ncbi:hypothetical protein PM082_020669 [Marasmius tenuissimus]|nr:hypothetical protein PM082_020669 [Marasmius tenuissimus]
MSDPSRLLTFGFPSDPAGALSVSHVLHRTEKLSVVLNVSCSSSPMPVLLTTPVDMPVKCRVARESDLSCVGRNMTWHHGMSQWLALHTNAAIGYSF